MAATTLALGTSSYALLEQLEGGDQLRISKSGSSTTIRATGGPGGTIEGLGITSGDLGSDLDGWTEVQSLGALRAEKNSNVNAFGNLRDFQASLGKGADALNIFGNIEGSRIFLDDAVPVNENGTVDDGNDLLSVSGSIAKGLLTNLEDNLIYAGSGNDTIRIAGSIEDAFVFLGAGNDSFTAASGINVDVKAADGNDYIQFKSQSTDVRINTGDNADTVVLAGLNGSSTELNGDSLSLAGTYEDQPFIFATQGQAAIDMGIGNDSLVLGSGSYNNVSFNTGNNLDTISIAKNSTFGNVFFQLGDSNSISNKDKFTSAQGNFFEGTTISSNNGGGDSLVFGSATQFLDSAISLAGGNDSIVFGTNSVINASDINAGIGADTLVFGSNTTFTDTWINLGNSDGTGDGLADRIYFNAISGDLSQVQITGADANDILYIGATAYAYNATENNFLNNNNISFFNFNNNPA
jgi:hypothetical protein